MWTVSPATPVQCNWARLDIHNDLRLLLSDCAAIMAGRTKWFGNVVRLEPKHKVVRQRCVLLVRIERQKLCKRSELFEESLVR